MSASSEVKVQENVQENNEVIDRETLKAQKKEAKQNKKNSKQPKQNKKSVGKKTGEVVSELKKVSWPKFGKVVKQTLVVLGFVVLCGVVLLGLNLLLSLGHKAIAQGIMGEAETFISLLK